MPDPADARRHIALEGTPNFRDFGGYLTADGRQVRWGQLYRSGALNRLTAADLDALAALDIRTVCDFRQHSERQREPSRWPAAAQTRHVHLPLANGDHAQTLKQLLDTGKVDVEQVRAAMAGINREFVVTHSKAYGQMLKHVLDAGGPVLIHCAAGKDRTGFGAAIILSALGVDEETIMADYLLSGHFLRIDRTIDKLLERYRLPVSRDVGLALFGVEPAYLRGAFESIAADYGDMPTYLRAGLGLDEAALSELRGRLLI
jgi:protein-tyrosine phosphatase